MILSRGLIEKIFTFIFQAVDEEKLRHSEANIRQLKVRAFFLNFQKTKFLFYLGSNSRINYEKYNIR
jgi:hypothetical protein